MSTQTFCVQTFAATPIKYRDTFCCCRKLGYDPDKAFRSGSTPPLPCSHCLVVIFFPPQIFSIISPLQDAAALTISVFVCDRHTLAAASRQPHLSPSPRCLMSARLFKGEKCDKSNRERRSDGWMNENGVSVYETAVSALMWCVKHEYGCVAHVWMCVCAGKNWSLWVLQRTILTF